MVLTAENYYSQEANEEYMSVSAVQGFLRYIWENALRIYCNGKAEGKMGRAEIEGPHGWKLCRFLL